MKSPMILWIYWRSGEVKDPWASELHPQKLTWNLEMMVSNRNLLFQGSIFRFHVCFGGCIYFLVQRMETCFGTSG